MHWQATATATFSWIDLTQGRRWSADRMFTVSLRASAYRSGEPLAVAQLTPRSHGCSAKTDNEREFGELQ